MEYVLGFAIAMLIGLTGTGGGVITAPVLALFLGTGPAESVGTALVFSAVVKLIAAPVYVARKQVHYGSLALLLAGGLPGVLGGSWALAGMKAARRNGPMLAILGAIVVTMAALNLYRLFFPANRRGRDRSRWLPMIALPIGADVGFSSTGAGALGSLALMTMTAVPAAQVVGTDVLFGLGLSFAGGGISLLSRNFDALLAWKLSAGGVLGALAGANLIAILPARPLRVALSLWLASLGGELCWRALAG